MKSVRVTCLVLLAGLTCVGLALVAAAPGQQAPPDPNAVITSASGAPASPVAGTTRPADTSAAPATPAATPAASQPVPAPIASPSPSRSPRPVGAANPAAAQAGPAVQSNWQALQQQAKAADAALGASVNADNAVPGPSGGADPEVQKWFEDAYKAETEQAQLFAKYAQTTDAKQKAEIKAELAKVLQRQFDLQLQQREREVSEIEARVRNLREMIEKRKTARQSIVTGRLDQLLNELDGMGWVAPTGPSSRGGSTFPQRSAGEATPSTPATRSAAPLPSAR